MSKYRKRRGAAGENEKRSALKGMAYQAIEAAKQPSWKLASAWRKKQHENLYRVMWKQYWQQLMAENSQWPEIMKKVMLAGVYNIEENRLNGEMKRRRRSVKWHRG